MMANGVGGAIGWVCKFVIQHLTYREVLWREGQYIQILFSRL